MSSIQKYRWHRTGNGLTWATTAHRGVTGTIVEVRTTPDEDFPENVNIVYKLSTSDSGITNEVHTTLKNAKASFTTYLFDK